MLSRQIETMPFTPFDCIGGCGSGLGFFIVLIVLGAGILLVYGILFILPRKEKCKICNKQLVPGKLYKKDDLHYITKIKQCPKCGLIYLAKDNEI